jgi:hypothetical protein
MHLQPSVKTRPAEQMPTKRHNGILGKLQTDITIKASPLLTTTASSHCRRFTRRSFMKLRACRPFFFFLLMLHHSSLSPLKPEPKKLPFLTDQTPIITISKTPRDVLRPNPLPQMGQSSKTKTDTNINDRNLLTLSLSVSLCLCNTLHLLNLCCQKTQ